MKTSNSNKPWKTDKWFTSSWNFLEDVRENIHFSDNIQFHDVSLRDGEQQSGLIFNSTYKRRNIK